MEENSVPPGKDAALRGRLEKLTGARTKAVWVRDAAAGHDIFALDGDLRLMGLDTRDARGVRPLSAETKNHSRPLLSPDGATVVYTERRNGGKDGVKVRRLDWETGADRELRDGYALDMWSDPVSGEIWIYALKTMSAVRSPNPMGGPLIRFPLTDPAREESVFDHGSINVDNVQVNRSGTRASGLLPWPQAGTFDFATGRFLRNRNGCWASLAPDDSNLSWVFDGSHQVVRLFLPALTEPWRVPLSKAEGMGGKSAYHPRWSNHPRVIAFSGPHGARIENGGAGIGIVVAKFNAACTGLEDSVNLGGEAKQSNYYPDVWVAGGEKVSLNAAELGPEKLRNAPAPTIPDAWTAVPEGLIFAWRSAEPREEVRVGDPPRACRVTPVRAARFTAWSGMLLDGGWFRVDDASSQAAVAAADSGQWRLEAAVTPLSKPEEERVILHAGRNLELRQRGEILYLLRGDKKWRMDAALPAGLTTHVVLSSSGTDKAPGLFLDGIAVEVKHGVPRPPGGGSAGPLTFGSLPDGGLNWHGALEGVTLHARPEKDGEAPAGARWWGGELGKREEGPRSRVRAKLEAASERSGPRDIAPYSRAWTAGRYRRVELLEGPDPGGVFTVAHWTILDKTPVTGPPGDAGEEVILELEPFASHPEMESEDGSADVCEGGLPDFLDVRRMGTP